MAPLLTMNARLKRSHLRWLRELTALPTAAGCEQRVVRWVEQWTAARPALKAERDKAGNILITSRLAAGARGGRRGRATPPLCITAHMDHPAFVVTGIGDGLIELEFRGGVHNPYFENARVELIDAAGRAYRAAIESFDRAATPFKRITVKAPRSGRFALGDIARWALPAPAIRGGILHTHACDDLAAVAAALAALDMLHDRPGFGHVGVLLTRAEEIGFVGAIAACKLESVPANARLICLENSRSFAESPIGAGPILRVGDKTSIFEPTLTNRLGDIFMEHAKVNPKWKWQRKLMPGGTCEATAFSAYGFQSTCLCLPLGNYHNMQDIDGVLAGKRSARVGREYISIDDFHGLVDMLLLAAAQTDSAMIKPLSTRMDALLAKHAPLVGLSDRR